MSVPLAPWRVLYRDASDRHVFYPMLVDCLRGWFAMYFKRLTLSHWASTLSPEFSVNQILSIVPHTRTRPDVL